MMYHDVPTAYHGENGSHGRHHFPHEVVDLTQSSTKELSPFLKHSGRFEILRLIFTKSQMSSVISDVTNV